MSVIVKHSTIDNPIKFLNICEKVFEEIYESDGEIREEDGNNANKEEGMPFAKVSKIKLDIDIPAINAMCTRYLVQEENSHLETIKFTFEKAWDEISLGEKMMNDYIQCCDTKNDFTAEYFNQGNKQFRYEVYLTLTYVNNFNFVSFSESGISTLSAPLS